MIITMRCIGCRFSGNDSRGGESSPVNIVVQLCNCSHENNTCVWDELQDGYNKSDKFQIVACDCVTPYEGQQCQPWLSISHCTALLRCQFFVCH